VWAPRKERKKIKREGKEKRGEREEGNTVKKNGDKK